MKQPEGALARLAGLDLTARLIPALGAMLTMIATHLPSNVLLLAVPLMPTGGSAAASADWPAVARALGVAPFGAPPRAIPMKCGRRRLKRPSWCMPRPSCASGGFWIT
jgi:hypothetical protein